MVAEIELKAISLLEQQQSEAHDPCTHLANAYRIRDTWCELLLYVNGKGWHTRTPNGPWWGDCRRVSRLPACPV